MNTCRDRLVRYEQLLGELTSAVDILSGNPHVANLRDLHHARQLEVELFRKRISDLTSGESRTVASATWYFTNGEGSVNYMESGFTTAFQTVRWIQDTMP